MAEFRLYITFFLFLIAITNATKSTEHRQLLTPEIHKCENDSSIVHVIAIGKNDTLHRIYSTKGSLVILTAITSHKAKFLVNCSNDEGSASFNELPYYSYALIFTKLYSFFDGNDTANVNLIFPHNVTTLPFYEMKWNPVQVQASNDNHSIIAEYQLLQFSKKFFANYSMSIKLSAFDFDDRSADLPHLMHIINSTQIQLTLDNVPYNFKKPRFAVQMAYVVTKPDSDFKVSYSRSLDDEFTPGIFKLVQVWTSNVRGSKLGAFIQWKPIVYTSVNPVIENSTVTYEADIQDYYFNDTAFEHSLAYAFYAPHLKKVSAQVLNVTFGIKGDEFYSKTNYSSWTLSTGYGIPPEDEISTAIIIVIVVGLGIPLLLLLIGGIYVFVRRSRNKDDLLLSH